MAEAKMTPVKVAKIAMPRKREKAPREQHSEFWTEQLRRIEQMTTADVRREHRHSVLPLARVKRIMKIDDDVREMMISSEVR